MASSATPWLPPRPLAEETGALEIRGIPGLSMFAEYLNKPDATADSYDEDGWFRTGDLVTVHADGWITFADRSKDMLRVGSENVAASEIERVIAEVPGVAEAAVVARPDVKLDEVPVAFVVAADGSGNGLAGEVIAACAAKLADFKVPQQVTVVAALPRSTISKVNKAALRAFLDSGDPVEVAERNWVAEAAADPSGDAP
jgi:crotonobetaine/carnitine-CoA ligase